MGQPRSPRGKSRRRRCSVARPGGHRLSVAPTNAPTCPVGMNGLRFVGGFGHVTVATAALVLPVEVRVPHEGGTVCTDPTLAWVGWTPKLAGAMPCHAQSRLRAKAADRARATAVPHALHDRRAHGPSQGLVVCRNMLYSVATCCTVSQHAAPCCNSVVLCSTAAARSCTSSGIHS